MITASWMLTVHPHACGENRLVGKRPHPATGSPPRLWGKPDQRVPRHHQARFTPTPVGKTSVAFLNHCAAPVHPHACGENLQHSLEISFLLGSPPRLWGKHDEVMDGVVAIRFTPTPVGKTRPHSCPLSTRSVHPHACGENSRNPRHARGFCGSPPRLWGKHLSTKISTTTTSVHPHACARAQLGTSVHPHACGENAGAGELGIAGSRFTPTPVGKTNVL